MLLKQMVTICSLLILLITLVTCAHYAPTVAPVIGIGAGGSVEDTVEFVVCDLGTDGSPWCSIMHVPDSPLFNWTNMGGATINSVSIITGGVALGQCGVYFYLFVRGTDNYLWWNDFCVWPSYSYFNLLGNWSRLDDTKQFQSAPVAVTMWWDSEHPGIWPANKMIYVFVRGMDNAVWYRSIYTEDETWRSLGGVTYDSPAVVSQDYQKMHVFIRGTDNAIWYCEYRFGNWGPWISLGETTSSAPAAASIDTDHVGVYIRGADNHLWCRHKFTAYPWSEWSRVGPDFEMTSGPGAFADPATNKIYIFARGSNNSVWVYDTFGDNQWKDMGGPPN